ncbi:aromatic-L-amino-acid decarboxylase [Talaromyces islandicus]|uniref:Aromatic-L-amino-acid decarboxylase n=1 Tax=Talaromyces islandicus TaxID=28573 RepID=A0A0U1LZD0_TALIS|nr:aromatic-L-amino-acid decarboxylase [Talaromyces islandicus]
MDREQFRVAAHAAIDDIINHFDTLPDRPVLPSIEPGYLRPLIPENPPAEPQAWADIKADIEAKIQPGLTHWQSPNFMAFFPASVTYPSILGEMYSAAFTAPAFNWICSPACTELETIIMDWVAKALALPDCFLSTSANGGGGVIQGTASESVATMMIAARERRARELTLAEGVKDGSAEYEDRICANRAKLVALSSDQAHSSIAKAALVSGNRYRSVPTRLADNMEMTGPALRAVLEQIEADGLHPFFITFNMGTTNSCAVDRVAELKAVLAEKESWRRIWVHIDAAYAGAALVADEYQHIAQDFAEGIDSFNMNMHKWLLVNFDASCLFVRNRTDLTNALDITPTYLRNPYSETGSVIDYRNWQISLGRRFRSLKIWFVMRSYGLTGMKAFIRKGIQLGEFFADRIRSRADLFEIVTRPAYGLTVFRVRNPATKTTIANGEEQVVAVDEKCNALTKEVYERISARGEVYLTSTAFAGIYAIRVVTGNMHSQEKYTQRVFDMLVEAAEGVLKGN